MNKEEFETLALDLLEATMNIAAQQKLSADHLIREHKKLRAAFEKGDVAAYESRASCVAYAMAFGLRSAYQAWSVLGKTRMKSKVGNVTILGGGCCFELPVLLSQLRGQQRELTVKVIDPVTHWRIFQPMLVRQAQNLGIRLTLDFVPLIDLLEQIDSYRTDLLVSFNGLDELSFGERNVLRTAYATCNRHLIWHSSLSVMQDIFHATYVPQMARENLFPAEELTESLRSRYPAFAEENPFANFTSKGFYLMHNLSQANPGYGCKWAIEY